MNEYYSSRAERWIASEPFSNERVEILLEIGWFGTPYFVSTLEDHHKASYATSGFNHELDDMVLIIQCIQLEFSGKPCGYRFIHNICHHWLNNSQSR